MKKGFLFSAFAVVLAFIFVLAAAPVVNDCAAKETADRLAALPLPDHTERIESMYRAGKLVGNGNGMQYFGAILIKSEQSLEALKEYYSKFAENEWDCVVEIQSGQEIKIVEHTKLAFQTDMDSGQFYIVYSWGNNDTIFHELDLRGH